jgi:hypothetical protein
LIHIDLGTYHKHVAERWLRNDKDTTVVQLFVELSNYNIVIITYGKTTWIGMQVSWQKLHALTKG